jgi:hypothetical protein
VRREKPRKTLETGRFGKASAKGIKRAGFSLPISMPLLNEAATRQKNNQK